MRHPTRKPEPAPNTPQIIAATRENPTRPPHQRYSQPHQFPAPREPPHQSIITLENPCPEQLQRWRENLILNKENPSTTIHGQSQMIIQTDDSSHGWRAHCPGTATGRKWPNRQQTYHISAHTKSPMTNSQIEIHFQKAQLR